jgi:hypothetical protein
MARINRDCARLIHAAKRRRKRFLARFGNPMQHPKWRKAVFAEIDRKVEKEWHLHGQNPEYARQNLMDEAYGTMLPT